MTNESPLSTQFERNLNIPAPFNRIMSLNLLQIRSKLVCPVKENIQWFDSQVLIQVFDASDVSILQLEWMLVLCCRKFSSHALTKDCLLYIGETSQILFLFNEDTFIKFLLTNWSISFLLFIHCQISCGWSDVQRYIIFKCRNRQLIEYCKDLYLRYW